MGKGGREGEEEGEGRGEREGGSQHTSLYVATQGLKIE